MRKVEAYITCASPHDLYEKGQCSTDCAKSDLT